MDRDDAKEEIRARVDLAELIGQTVRLTKSGQRFRGLCPFHDEKTPSFYVDPARGFWHCFGCGAGGDLYAFPMQQENVDFPEAMRRLAERAGVTLETTPQATRARGRREMLERANQLARDRFIHNLFKHPAAEHARQYVRARGFTKQTITEFGLGFALDEWDDIGPALAREGINTELAREAGLVRQGERGGHYDVFRNRLMFPIVDVNDRVIGFGGRTLDPENPAKYVNSEETPLFRKGRSLYGLNVARKPISDAGQALIVEGYTDVLSLHQAGVTTAVAGLGTALTPEQLQLLSRYCDEIVFIYDGDKAGAQAALRNLEVLESAKARVSLVVLPEGIDPDDFVRSHGREGLDGLIADRLSPVDYQINMVFARHAEDGADGRAQAASEAVEVLLNVQDPTRREDYLARASDRWGRSNPGRTEAMQRVLRMELRRRLAEQRGRGAAAGARDPGFISKTLTDGSRGLMRAETELLSLALDNEPIARLVARALQPADLVTTADAAIVEALCERLASDEGLDARGLVAGLPEEGGVRERGVELLVAETPGSAESSMEELEELAQAAICRLQASRAAAGQGMRYQTTATSGAEAISPEEFAEMRRQVLEGISAGTITQEDPAYRKYCELAALLKSTTGGYAQDFVKVEAEEDTGEGKQPPRSVTAAEVAPPRAETPSVPATVPEAEAWAAEEGDPFGANDE